MLFPRASPQSSPCCGNIKGRRGLWLMDGALYPDLLSQLPASPPTSHVAPGKLLHPGRRHLQPYKVILWSVVW